MFKNFFQKFNKFPNEEKVVPALAGSTTSYDELYKVINSRREEALHDNGSNLTDNIERKNFSIPIPGDVEINEMDNFLQVKGSALNLQRIADELQSMEFLAPGDLYKFGDWRFLVTEGVVTSSKTEKFIALPPDEWLMMGCKFNDAISGYDTNPYTYFKSPFGTIMLPYGIEFFVTDLSDEAED